MREGGSLRISNMRYMIEVSRWQSINKASKHLFVNQQQLSRIIASAESDLGLEIFNRNTKGAFLTTEGESVIKKFEEIVALYDSIGGHQVKEEKIQGKIQILTELNIWTSYARFYKDFVKHYPDIDLSIKMMATGEIMDYLLENEGIGMISRIVGEGIADYEIPKKLSFLPVAKDHVMVYGGAGNRYFQKYKTISLATLCELPLINFKPYNNYPSLMERVFAHVGVPNIKYEVGDVKLFRELAVETECLFLTFRRPKYAGEDAFGEIPLRDQIFFENGILKRQKSKSNLDEIFARYYLAYYQKLYQTPGL